jgi:hypothetical protein
VKNQRKFFTPRLGKAPRQPTSASITLEKKYEINLYRREKEWRKNCAIMNRTHIWRKVFEYGRLEDGWRSVLMMSR